MATQISVNHPLRKLFGFLTERSFTETLGWPDFNVTEYLANLLVQFAHIDQLHWIKNQEGQTVETVVDLLYESEVAKESVEFDHEREVHRHIGDFTLFMMGLFPEYLTHIKTSGLVYHQDFLVDYVKTGKRSYGIVAEFAQTDNAGSPALFQTLSSNFELCVTGLGLVRLDLDRMKNPAYQKSKDILLH